MHFVGIDLAWSARNNSAAAAIEAEQGHGKLIDHKKQLEADDEIIAFISKVSNDGPTIVGIDAPLIVPNTTRLRPCDRDVTREFGRYHAGAHSANRNLLKRDGKVRGEELVKRLRTIHFIHDYNIPRHSDTCRQVVEVYPHPATINLFKLKQVLKYKRGTMKDRQKELNKLQQYIASLKAAEPALHVHEQYFHDTTQLHGYHFKAHEDFLDAILCAYIVYHAWYWGEQGYEVFGGVEKGYILVPKVPA